MWVFIQKKSEAGLYSQDSSAQQGASSECPFFVVCLNKGSAWETRSQSCIISFLGLGQETRKSPEGTLIRRRKQHKELSFSPTGMITQPSKTSKFVRSLYIPLQTRCSPPPEPNTMHSQAPVGSLSKPTSPFLSVQTPQVSLGSGLHPKQSFSDGFNPNGLSLKIVRDIQHQNLQHQTHFHCLDQLLFYRGVSAPGIATSWRTKPFLEFLLL